MVADQLVVEPDVLEGQAKLLEEMEDQLQFRVDQRLPRDAAIEHGHTHHVLPVQDGHGNLDAEQFELLLRCRVAARLLALAPQDPAQAKQLAANAGLERQLEMLQQAGRQAQRAGRPQLPALSKTVRAAQRNQGRPQENRRPVKAKDSAEQEQELLEQALRIEGLGENAGEIAQDAEGLRRAGNGNGGRLDCLDRLLRRRGRRVGRRVRGGGGSAQSRPSRAASMRGRTGLASTWAAPCT